MDLKDMCAAIESAEDQLRRADVAAERMARILRGRLRRCRAYDVAALKRELRDFDLRSECWKADR